jgi:hypothetical protein
VRRTYPTIRLTSSVHADFPFSVDGRANPGGEVRAYMNHYGAVSIETPGGLLGVKPAEFTWVHGRPDTWHTGTTCGVATNLAIVTETSKHRVFRMGPGMGIEKCGLGVGHDGPHRPRLCCWSPHASDTDTRCPICRGVAYIGPERRIAFRDFRPVPAERPGVLYGPRDAERMHEDVGDALEAIFGEIVVVNAPVEVLVYERVEIDERAVQSMARNLVEWWNEQFNEDYGGDDGEGESGANADEALALVKSWTTRAVPWQCEPTGEVIVLDADDLSRFDYRVIQPADPEPA